MIVLQGVSKSYDGGATYSVRDVSFQVPPGQLLVLMGGSGCGKTTTLKMINRLIEPTGGRLFLDDEDVTGVDPVGLRRRIGYVIQPGGGHSESLAPFASEDSVAILDSYLRSPPP